MNFFLHIRQPTQNRHPTVGVSRDKYGPDLRKKMEELRGFAFFVFWHVDPQVLQEKTITPFRMNRLSVQDMF